MTSDNENVSSKLDFRAFVDWDVAEQGEWPSDLMIRPLTQRQKAIVGRNVNLLKVRDVWIAKIDAFEKELSKIKDVAARKKKRAEFSIRFDHHEFRSTLPNFENYYFPCSVSFYKTQFKWGDVIFDRATFAGGDVFFDGATFKGENVSFDGATFSDEDVSFKDATFECENVSFRNVTLENADISFVDAVIKGNFFARKITYPADANFQRMSVGGTADFSNSTFHEVPDFTDSKFDRPPDVSGIEVLAFKGWNVWKLWVCPFWNVKSNEGAKFRKLKAMALAANDHEKDGEFFAYEMLAKRGFEAGSTGPVALFINWLYFTFSNFGQSYLRPFLFLIFSLLAGGLVYGAWIGSNLANADRWWFAFDYSFRNFLPLFGSLFRFAPQPSDHESWFDKTFHELAHSGFNVDWLTYVGIFQNFIGLILLFLLLLGLRNKFRLK